MFCEGQSLNIILERQLIIGYGCAGIGQKSLSETFTEKWKRRRINIKLQVFCDKSRLILSSNAEEKLWMGTVITIV